MTKGLVLAVALALCVLGSAWASHGSVSIPLERRKTDSTSPFLYESESFVPGRTVRIGRSPFANNNNNNGEDNGLFEEGGELTANGTGSTPLYGKVIGLAEFYAIVEVGGQTFRLQVDSGSSTMGIPAKGCKSFDENGQETGGCKATDSPYDSSKSGKASEMLCNSAECAASTASCIESTCGFSVQYVDGSGMAGPRMYDQVQFRGTNISVDHASFGAITHVVGNFQFRPVDGILGVSYSDLNDGIPTVLDRMHASGALEKYVHSMCLTEEGGHWDLGHVDDSRYMPGTLRYAPLVPIEQGRPIDLFTVEMLRLDIEMPSGGAPIVVEDVQSDIPPAAIDSGTTLLTMPSNMINKLGNRLLDLGSSLPHASEMLANGCAEMSDDQIDQWPSLLFHVWGGQSRNIDDPSNFVLRLPARYWIRRIPGEGVCFLISELDISVWLLGDEFMQAFYTVFDVENSRLGFGDVNPENCQAVTDDTIPPKDDTDDGLLLGAVVVTVLLLIGIGTGLYCYRRKRMQKDQQLLYAEAPDGGDLILPPAPYGGSLQLPEEAGGGHTYEAYAPTYAPPKGGL